MKNFQEILEKFRTIDGEKLPYPLDAYAFLMDALHYTVSSFDQARHVSGGELLEGIRKFAMKEYGPMAKTVLNYWQITETLDFGKLVFALVESGILRKQDGDKLEDFANGYNFDEAFKYSFDDCMEENKSNKSSSL